MKTNAFAASLLAGVAFFVATGAGLGSLLVGCGRAVPAKPETTPVGEFALASIDGRAVPAKILHDGQSVEVRSGSLAFGTDGTCRSETRFVIGGGREIHRVVTATVRSEGDVLVLRWHGAGTTWGRLNDGRFAMTNEESVFVYRR